MYLYVVKDLREAEYHTFLYSKYFKVGYTFHGFDSQEIHERMYSLNGMWFDLDELRIKGVMNIILYCSLRSTYVINIFTSKTFLQFKGNRQFSVLF